MQDFIRQAAGALGTSEDTTRTATGGLLELVSRHAASGDKEQLFAALPGADGLLGAFRTKTGGEGAGEGGGGGLLGAAASMLGGGGSLGSLAMLQKSGLDMNKAQQLAKMFMSYASEHAGGDLVRRIASTIPGASAFL